MSGSDQEGMMASSKSAWWHLPRTRLGWWASGLAAANVFMGLINSAVLMRLNQASTGAWWQNLLPFYGIAMLLCGLIGGILGLISILRMRERSWLVWLALLPAVMTLVLVFGEFLIPH